MRFEVIRRAGVLAAALVLATSGAALGHGPVPIDDGVEDSGKEVHGGPHGQHGGSPGHISVTNYGVDLVSKLRLTTAEGRIADVGVWNGYAYLGAFRQDACSGPESIGPDGGVYIVDIREPANPVEVGFLAIHQDSFAGEGIQAINISTPKFTGDILAINSEACGKNDKGGFTLYDVTNPRKPMKLVENYGDFNVGLANHGNDANDIHSAFMWEDDNNTGINADDKAYIAVVDDLETTDVDIFDITNPRKPILVAEWDLDVTFPAIVDPTLGAGGGFLHDLVVKKIGGNYIGLLSYWDSGYVLLNLNNPASPSLIADSDYIDADPLSGLTPAGNGHQAEYTNDNAFIVAADEDFSPFALTGTNVTETSNFEVTSGRDTPQLAGGTSVTGDTVFVGLACPGGPAVPAATAAGKIALVERGTCTFTEKVAAVEASGGSYSYEAVIIFNRQGPDGCSDLVTMLVAGNIPAFFVNRPTGFAFLGLAGYDEAACRSASGATTGSILLGTVGDEVTIASEFDGWGYIRLFSATPDGSNKLVELDQFAIPEAFMSDKASGFGALSVHEVAASALANDIVYVAYYAGGFRVLQIDNDSLVEVGAWIDPPPGTDYDAEGNNFWGVQVFQDEGVEYVAASDRDYGLYIFRYNPNP